LVGTDSVVSRVVLMGIVLMLAMYGQANFDLLCLRVVSLVLAGEL